MCNSVHAHSPSAGIGHVSGLVLHTCTMSGESSKKRWQRMEGYEQLRFPLNSELACLVNKCMLPFLRELLLENNDSYYIYLAMELQFHQCTNWEDICTRWSSFRHVKQLLETLITQKHKSRITLHIFTFFFFFFFDSNIVFFIFSETAPGS